jgi:hypothetical protein
MMTPATYLLKNQKAIPSHLFCEQTSTFSFPCCLPSLSATPSHTTQSKQRTREQPSRKIKIKGENKNKRVSIPFVQTYIFLSSFLPSLPPPQQKKTQKPRPGSTRPRIPNGQKGKKAKWYTNRSKATQGAKSRPTNDMSKVKMHVCTEQTVPDPRIPSPVVG